MSVNPRSLFRAVAIGEAVTWALLLGGMFVKYATEARELGEDTVSVFGMLHGVVFVAYCLVTVLVAVDQRWSGGRFALGLVAAVPPFATVVFERYAERRGALDSSWRLRAEAPRGPAERTVAWLLRNPLPGAAAGLVALAALTGVALLLGPPAG